MALGRLLHGDFDVTLFYAKPAKSKMALLQKQRATTIGIKESTQLLACDVLVDAIVGTGFSGEFEVEMAQLIEQMNSMDAFKIACDVPSLYLFEANITLTMGALKKRMFLDEAKEFVGEIKVLNLGVSRDIYESKTNWNLLDLEDLKLPYRDKKVLIRVAMGI